MGRETGLPSPDPVAAIYRRALPHVYGYLLPRCGSVSLAEDLTAETFIAAVAAARQPGAQAAPGAPGAPGAPEITIAWLIGVARHKLADHWRRSARERRTVAAAAVSQPSEAVDDPWPEWLDTETAYAALRCLNPHQRAALTLRYLDGLPVAEVAAHLGRSLRATETLLARARAALRAVYQEEERHGR